MFASLCQMRDKMLRPFEEVYKRRPMEVCEICGAMLFIDDAPQRLDDHIQGKQHVGYARIRAYIGERQKKRQEVIVATIVIHCVSKKRHPFYFCKNFAKYYPISIIFGSSIPQEICNKTMHVYPPHLFTVLILYLAKIVIHVPMFTLF